MVISGEFSNFLDGRCSSAKSVEDLGDTSTLLHGDDSELILFVNPDEESLGIVVEDTSALWPVSVKVASSQESVTLLEQEVVVDELLLDLLIHTLEWVESSFQVSLEFATSFNNLLHDFVSLLLGNTWSKWVVGKISSNSNSG